MDTNHWSLQESNHAGALRFHSISPKTSRSPEDMHHPEDTRCRGQRRQQDLKQDILVDIDEAVAEVIAHNERMMHIGSNSHAPAERAAIRRMEAVLADLEDCVPGMNPHQAILQIEVTMASFSLGTTTSEPMCIVDIFNDLDTIFFGGILRGQVDVSWGSGADFDGDYEKDLGCTESTDLSRCSIILNKDMLTTPGSWPLLERVWSTLLHEMCHAVPMTRVPEERWNDEPHDAQFRILIHAVHRHSFQHFLLPAIDKSETYKHNHLMSDEWADDSGPDADEVGSTDGESDDDISEDDELAGDGDPESSERFAEPGVRGQYLKAVKAWVIRRTMRDHGT